MRQRRTEFSIGATVCLVPGGKRQQRDVPRLLDGAGQTALVRGANAAQTPRHNLAALGHELLQQPHVAVRNRRQSSRCRTCTPSCGEKTFRVRRDRRGLDPDHEGRSPVRMSYLARTNFVELRPTSRTILPGFLQPSCFLIPFLCSGLAGESLEAIRNQGSANERESANSIASLGRPCFYALA